MASKAKYFPTGAGNGVELCIHFDAVATINSSAELVIFVSCYEHLAQFLFELLHPKHSLHLVQSQYPLNSLQQNWMRTTFIHAAREGRAALNGTFEVSHPTFQTIVVPANIIVYGNFFIAANIAGANHSPVEGGRTVEGGLEAYLFEIRLIVIVVFLF